MKAAVVALRVSRRALAAVVIEDERLHFFDGRHVSSRRERAVPAAERYVRKVIESVAPVSVIIDAPTKAGSLGTELLIAVHKALAEAHVPAETIDIAQVLASYGLPALRTRKELQDVVQQLWPELTRTSNKSGPFVLEAAAVALYATTLRELGVVAA